jgi:hypothetical protein
LHTCSTPADGCATPELDERSEPTAIVVVFAGIAGLQQDRHLHHRQLQQPGDYEQVLEARQR